MADKKGTLEEQIQKDFLDKIRGNTVVIFIPSHDKKEKEIRDQQEWASQAVDLFGHVFGGSTGFNNLLGTWFDPAQKKILHDNPIMIQSLVSDDRYTEANLKKILAFGQRMGRETNQACVGVVANDVMYEIVEFPEE